jgi:low affinity Fe/Cu permease
MKALFRHVAALSSVVVGTARAFAFALLLVAVLVTVCAFFGYSVHWLALFSAVLSAVTFLLVFLLQYRENRDREIERYPNRPGLAFAIPTPLRRHEPERRP